MNIEDIILKVVIPLFFISLITVTIAGVVYSDGKWTEWFDEMETFSCTELKVSLDEDKLNDKQIQEILKRLHTHPDNCNGGIQNDK